jgi:hypothetical protein
LIKRRRLIIIIDYAMDNESKKTRTTSYAVIAIVVVLGLLGVVVLTVTVAIPLQQQADAAGCRTSTAFNASKGRCFGHGP